MKTIYKYPIAVMDRVTIQMPRGAEILHIGSQVHISQLEFWALVDTDMPWEARIFEIRGTGHDAKGLDARDHVATVVGSLVWHVFEPGRAMIKEGEKT